MDEKNTLVLEYINGVREIFEKYGNHISDENVSKVINQYLNSSKSFEEIKKEIDKLVEEKLDKLRKRKELIEKMQQKVTKGITDLSVDTKGITLNMQQIDLLSIVTADETNLNQVLANIQNITDEQRQSILSSNKSLAEIKKDLFKMYQDSLTSYVDTNFSLDGKQKELSKRIDFILNNCGLSQEQQRQLVDIVMNNQLYNIPKLISETYDEEVCDRIFKTLIRYMPTEKEGIKSASYESFERLAEHLSDYQVINLDDIAKYGHYVRQDGGFNSDDLIKAFDFARSRGMQTRLNTLLFYMDTPQILESISYEQGKVEAKSLLERYVENITSVIAKYNNSCIQRGEQPTVRTVEIFNELLNRFAMDGNVPYEYRGHIDIDEHRVSKDNSNYDNLRGGWLRFFEVEELCSIMEIARKNLPNVNLMINECNLEDPRKIEPFKKLVLDKIKAYEQQQGIKLIDSIGTQMHIDSSVSKDDIKTMFDNLSQFGLPIEVTEFDMAIDQNFINSHSQEEIVAFKRQKINDFCDVVAEMQERGNIVGVTIWSVSDTQNFVVYLTNQKIYQKNLEREKQGLKPIPYVRTLYGGYYDSNMQDITRPKINGFNQKFNYHTHTYRSGHSEYVSDEEMLQAAKSMGISMLGFSEHIPNSDLILPDENHRMLLSEVDGYIASINKMKQDNPDMTILVGFEAEFDPMKEAFLGEMRDKVDYMILGQHFITCGLQKIPSNNNPNYPIEYANMVSKAIESGIFDIVAHPDHFMEFRDTIVSEEDKKLFDKNAILASQIICEKARDMGIPIEINMSPALNDQILSDGNLTYPHPIFWKVAQEIDGLQVLKGVDAHDLSAFKNVNQAQQLIGNIEQMVSDKLIKSSYNPVAARQNNSKLQEAYRAHQENALTFEAHMISQIINGTFGSVEDNLDSESIAIAVENSLNVVMQNCINGANKKHKSTIDEILDIADSLELSSKDKKGKLERKKQVISETNKVLANQQKVIETAKKNVVNAMNIGCENKYEYSNIVTQMTQHQTTKKESQKSKIEEQISSFQQTKTGKKINSQNIGRVKVLKKANNKYNLSNGFIDVLLLTLIVIFVIGIAVGIGYLLYSFSI